MGLLSFCILFYVLLVLFVADVCIGFYLLLCYICGLFVEYVFENNLWDLYLKLLFGFLVKMY